MTVTIFYSGVKYQSISIHRGILSNLLVIVLIVGCVGDAESFPGVLSFVPTQGLLLVFVAHFLLHEM